MKEQIMEYIVQYGPGVVSVISVIIASAFGGNRFSKLFKNFKETAMSESDEKLQGMAAQNELLKKQNAELKEMVAEMRSENMEIKKSLRQVTARISHMEFREK